jgi:hypothetical protein
MFDWLIQRSKTAAYLRKLYANVPNAMEKLSNKISLDIVLVCAMLAGEKVLPLGAGSTLVRNAQENAVFFQFANYIFLDRPNENDDPFSNSPFYKDSEGCVQVQWHLDPKAGNLMENTFEGSTMSFFGPGICNLQAHSAALQKVWPYPQYNVTLNDLYTNGGREKIRAVHVHKVFPKLAVSTAAEVELLQKGFILGKYKFKKIKNSINELGKVAKTTIVNATTYQQIGASTTLINIARDRGKRPYTDAAMGDVIVPASLVVEGRTIKDVMQFTLHAVLEEIGKKTPGYLGLLLHLLKYVVQEYRKNLIEDSGSDSSESESESESDEEESGSGDREDFNDVDEDSGDD